MFRGVQTVPFDSAKIPNERTNALAVSELVNRGAVKDGDLVVIEKRDSARNGEIVVALINDAEATLKRLQNNHDGSVTLIAENSTTPPMTYAAEQVQIPGVLPSLLRRY